MRQVIQTSSSKYLIGSLALLLCALLFVGCGQEGTESTAPTPSVPATLDANGTAAPTSAATTSPTSAGVAAPTAPVLPELSSLSEEDALAAALSIAEELLAQNTAAVAAQFDTQLAALLNEEALSQAWRSTTAITGTFYEIAQSSLSYSGENAVVSLVLDYEYRDLRLLLTLTPQLSLTGLYMNYYTLVETDAPEGIQQLAVRVGDSYPLDGILTLPEGVEQPPVVLLIQGSGQSDYNESIGTIAETGEIANRPFADLANGLAQAGIASLRYNKRYYQYPEAAMPDMAITDEVLADAAAAIQLLLNDPRVDRSRIYVLGHSLGGMLAPKIAADSPFVAGLISLAGSPRPLLDIVYDQQLAALAADTSLTDEERSALLELIDGTVAQIRGLSGSNLAQSYFGVSGYYWNSLNELELPAIATSLSIPMLFLQGDTDFQVSPEKDFGAWQTLCADKENAQFRLYNGLNHLFMTGDGSRGTAEYDVPAHVSEAVIADIAAFILEGRLR